MKKIVCVLTVLVSLSLIYGDNSQAQSSTFNAFPISTGSGSSFSNFNSVAPGYINSKVDINMGDGGIYCPNKTRYGLMGSSYPSVPRTGFTNGIQ